MNDLGLADDAIGEMITALEYAQRMAEVASRELLDESWARSERHRLVECQFHINSVLELLETHPIQFPS